VLQWHLSAPC